MKLETRALENQFVRLEPLEEGHREPLRAVADDPDLWRYIPRWGHGSHFDAMFDAFLPPISSHAPDERPARASAVASASACDWIRYSVRRRREGDLIGQTAFLAIDAHNARVEIGATWYAAPFHGGATNPSCKYLMMEAAFSSGARRVEFKTDARNARSRAAILKLGAKEEGRLRRHTLMPDGFVRDTIYFSVLDDEWPAVRTALAARLSSFI